MNRLGARVLATRTMGRVVLPDTLLAAGASPGTTATLLLLVHATLAMQVGTDQ